MAHFCFVRRLFPAFFVRRKNGSKQCELLFSNVFFFLLICLSGQGGSGGLLYSSVARGINLPDTTPRVLQVLVLLTMILMVDSGSCLFLSRSLSVDWLVAWLLGCLGCYLVWLVGGSLSSRLDLPHSLFLSQCHHKFLFQYQIIISTTLSIPASLSPSLPIPRRRCS